MANTFINIKETFTIADNFASLPSSAQRGALAVTADTGGVYTFNGTTWVLQTGGGGGVTSVNGQTGVVVLTKNDIGLGQVDNTSDLNKPISNATQTALNTKASLTDAFVYALIFG